jgi:hypothetical protein
MANLLA